MEYVLPAAWRSTHSPISLALHDQLRESDNDANQGGGGGAASSALSAGGATPSSNKGKGKGRRVKHRGGGGGGGAQQQGQRQGAELPTGREVLERLNLFWAFVDSCGERLDVDRSFSGWPIITACRYGKRQQAQVALQTSASAAAADTEVVAAESQQQVVVERSAAQHFAMSVEVARSHHALSRGMYSADELGVLDRCGVLFLTGAAERLAVHIQGTEKVNPAVRALARHFTSEQSNAGSGGGGVAGGGGSAGERGEGELQLRSELRELILGWSGDDTTLSDSGSGGSGQQRRGNTKPGTKGGKHSSGGARGLPYGGGFENMPESTLRQLPIFETLDGAQRNVPRFSVFPSQPTVLSRLSRDNLSWSNLSWSNLSWSYRRVS